MNKKKTATWPPLPTPNSYAYQEYLTYIKAIEHGWKSQGVVLLQGGSSTALTKISLQIALQNAQDGTVLYLLPTIKQITVHLPKIKKFFGEHYGIYHAETKASEKLRIRHALQKGKLKLVVGTRSALFLPFAKLATIIVTEEENQAYKQTIQSMRYHVIDAARIRAKQERARVLLTTTTPSITSYYHASNHRYGYVKIPYQASVPIRLVHVKRKKKLSRTPYQLAPAIISFLRNRYSKNQQSIVLHNRRGYAAYIRCSACYWFPSCVKCDRSLSYHQTKNQLICHYCKVVASVPSSCIKCSSQRLQYQKMGTQQVEELVQLYMPEARVQRIDGDVVKGTKKYLEALHLFRDKKIDILVATPSIINLMPIGDPCMIVVLSIEDWFYPSFTTYEKNYQLLARLSQKTIATSLVIQLRWYRNPELTQLVQNLIQQNYTAIYNHMLAERKDYNYPPYAGLIKVSWLHIAKNKVIDLSEKCTELYTKQLGLEVLGPTPARKSNCKYKVVLWCKLPHTVDAKRLKKEVYRIAYEQLDPSIRPKAQLIFDVDPI